MNRLLLFILLLKFSTAICAQEVIKSVYFDYNKYTVPDSAMIQLVKFIHSHNIERALLEGHCDSVGSKNYNYKLSVNRANAVKKLLTDNGIAKTNIKSCIGYGKDKPVNNNATETERQENRRVQITFYTLDTVLKASPIVNPSQALNAENFKSGNSIVLNNLVFIGGRHILKPQSIPILEKLTEILIANSTVRVEIQGHVCCTNAEPDGYDWDTGTYNLSVNRAAMVYEYLIQHGISPKRLSYKGFGGTRKLYEDESDDEQRSANRRVELKILE